MGIYTADSEVKQAELQAVVIKKDGTRVPLGRIAYHHRSRWHRLVHRMTGRTWPEIRGGIRNIFRRSNDQPAN